MERLTHKRSNGIKEGYWSPNKKDELVTRLAQYEDTGLTPEELKQLQHDGNTIADQIRSMFDQCKVIKLNENTEVMIRFTEKMTKDYANCKEKAAVPGGPGKNCAGCSLDFPGRQDCLLTMFPDIEEDLEKRMAGDRI